MCTFERARGGLEPPVIHIDDYCRMAAQAESLASVLSATAHMAAMSGATLSRDEAHKQSENPA
jgi:hypothetical protein